MTDPRLNPVAQWLYHQYEQTSRYWQPPNWTDLPPGHPTRIHHTAQAQELLDIIDQAAEGT